MNDRLSMRLAGQHGGPAQERLERAVIERWPTIDQPPQPSGRFAVDSGDRSPSRNSKARQMASSPVESDAASRRFTFVLQTQWRTQLRALLLASGPCGLLYLAWWYLTPTAPVDVLIPSDLGVALLLPTIVAHELLHYMALPSGPACIQKGFVFRPEQSWAIGVGYQGEIGRSRLVAVLLTPLMVLSIAPLLVAAVFSIDSASLAYISIWNAIGSSLDLFNGSGLLLGVRTGAALRVQGMSIMTDGLRANVAKYFFHIPDDAQPTAEPEAVK